MRRAFARTPALSPRCPYCAYCLIGVPEPRCPECGRRFDPRELQTALEGPVAASPWDNRGAGLLPRLFGTVSYVLRSPDTFVTTFPTFYDPANAKGLWFACAGLGGLLHLLRFSWLLVARDVAIGVALVASTIAAMLLLAVVWAVEWALAHVISRCLRASARQRSYLYWRGILRYGVVFVPATAFFYLLRQVAAEEAATVEWSAVRGTLSAAAAGAGLVGKIGMVLWWWLYLYRAVADCRASALGTTAAIACTILLTAIAVLCFGFVGGTLRWLA